MPWRRWLSWWWWIPRRRWRRWLSWWWWRLPRRRWWRTWVRFHRMAMTGRVMRPVFFVLNFECASVFFNLVSIRQLAHLPTIPDIGQAEGRWLFSSRPILPPSLSSRDPSPSAQDFGSRLPLSKGRRETCGPGALAGDKPRPRAAVPHDAVRPELLPYLLRLGEGAVRPCLRSGFFFYDHP